MRVFVTAVPARLDAEIGAGATRRHIGRVLDFGGDARARSTCVTSLVGVRFTNTDPPANWSWTDVADNGMSWPMALTAPLAITTPGAVGDVNTANTDSLDDDADAGVTASMAPKTPPSATIMAILAKVVRTVGTSSMKWLL